MSNDMDDLFVSSNSQRRRAIQKCFQRIPNVKSVHLKNVDKFFQKRPELLKRIADGGSVKILVTCLKQRYDVIFTKNETFAVLNFYAPKSFSIFDGYANNEKIKIVGKTKLNPNDQLSPSVGAAVAIDRADAAKMSYYYSLVNDSVIRAKNVRNETHKFISHCVNNFPPKKK